jgi:hypothetical protein
MIRLLPCWRALMFRPSGYFAFTTSLRMRFRIPRGCTPKCWAISSSLATHHGHLSHGEVRDGQRSAIVPSRSLLTRAVSTRVAVRPIDGLTPPAHRDGWRRNVRVIPRMAFAATSHASDHASPHGQAGARRVSLPGLCRVQCCALPLTRNTRRPAGDKSPAAPAPIRPEIASRR